MAASNSVQLEVLGRATIHPALRGLEAAAIRTRATGTIVAKATIPPQGTLGAAIVRGEQTLKQTLYGRWLSANTCCCFAGAS